MPAAQQPLKFGADLVLHSATKFIDGQGRVLGGVVVGNKDLINQLYLFIRNTGPSMSPFNAWVLTKSLETLFIRMERHAENALYLAKKLQGNTKLSWVKYPFLPDHPQYEIAKKQMSNGGGLLTFELKAGVDGGRKFLNALQMISMTNNLGDSRSIASHPTSTSRTTWRPSAAGPSRPPFTSYKATATGSGLSSSRMASESGVRRATRSTTRTGVSERRRRAS